MYCFYTDGREENVSDILSKPRVNRAYFNGKILPHPIYVWMGWICSINPSEKLLKN